MAKASDPAGWPALLEKAAVAAVVGIATVAVFGALREKTSAIDSATGWGVDACLSTHVPVGEVAAYLELLGEARLRYVRERGPDNGSPREDRPAVFRRLKQNGYRVVAFCEFANALPVQQRGDQLPEDLMAVYWSARKMAARYAGLVDVWEMVGEADTQFCTDLPDRVAAFQKALYLGIRDSVPATQTELEQPPGILMGALGHAPSPWLARAAANGLLDYTDGLNFHFYGLAGDLRGVVEAQRKFADRFAKDRQLPLWITECGMNAVPAGKPDDARARRMQRDFTVETASIAREEGVAVFMPFILAHKGDDYALTASVAQPYPAWTAYARYTRFHALEPGPVLAPPKAPPRLVLQWLPDNRTCIPNKVSGAYWFRGGSEKPVPMSGVIAAYNFSDRPIRGRVVVDAPSAVSMSLRNGAADKRDFEIDVPAFSTVRIPLQMNANRFRYFRGNVAMRFAGEGSRQDDTQVVFGVATRPYGGLLARIHPLVGNAPRANFQWIWAPGPCEVTSRQGPWIGLNGVRVEPTGGSDTKSLAEPWTFDVAGPSDDPTMPPMAVTAVEGLPEVKNGFLRLRLPRTFPISMGIRVDLVDRLGQRFSISENLGRNWLKPDPRLIYLSYEDFHIYPWGRCTDEPVFEPSAIREIQFRFFPPRAGARVAVLLDVVSPGPLPRQDPGKTP
ncbi:MAG: hypothetical protein ACREKL_07645 [Chthoniobacterales bacterium]